MTHLTYRNGVSIAELIVYVPALLVSILVASRLGFGFRSGWYFLIIFCLARIVGPIMQLLTINDPSNISLYVGYSVLNSVGLSPLSLAAIGLLNRLVNHINRSHRSLLRSWMLLNIEVIIFVALVLGIIGGVQAGNKFTSTGSFTPGVLSKVATALYLVAWLLLAISTLLAASSLQHAERTERRLCYAVAASLPLLLVRLVYSIGSTFTHQHIFNLLLGSTTVLLCVALIEEFLIVCIFLGVGLTLKRLAPIPDPETAVGQHDNRTTTSATPMMDEQQGQQPQKKNLALRMLNYTIIGRIVMAARSKRDQQKEQGYEMQ